MDYHLYFHNFLLLRKGYFTELLEKPELNQMEVEILVYLSRNTEKNTFTEVQKWNDYSKSHISTSITRLIDKGYVSRDGSEKNKKIHYLNVQEKSKGILDEYGICVKKFHKDAFSDISSDEKEMLDGFMDKIYQNLQTIKESEEV